MFSTADYPFSQQRARTIASMFVPPRKDKSIYDTLNEVERQRRYPGLPPEISTQAALRWTGISQAAGMAVLAGLAALAWVALYFAHAPKEANLALLVWFVASLIGA